MRAVRLLEYAVSKEPETVLDVGVGKGKHAYTFLAHGARVTGVDVANPPIQHPLYDHVQSSIEFADLNDRKYDVIWCSHTLEHLPNPQHALIKMRSWLKDDGFLAIAVPTDRQSRLHIGHVTLWTPAHLLYNLICAGWDCKDALWYTEYCTIGAIVPAAQPIDYSGRTGTPAEINWLNQYTPVFLGHNCAAWLQNNWHEETEQRVPDPPFVTVNIERTNLPPNEQKYWGPNPYFRKPPYGEA